MAGVDLLRRSMPPPGFIVRGLLRPLMLEHAVEGRPGRDLILVTGGVLVFLRVGLVGRDIGDVGESADDLGRMAQATVMLGLVATWILSADQD